MKKYFLFTLLLSFVFLHTGCVEKKKIDKNTTKQQTNIEVSKPDTTKNIIPDKIEIISNPVLVNRISAVKFTRGIYLTAYTVSSKKFYAILDSAEASGINTVIFDLKNMNGTIFFSIPQRDSLMHKKVEPIIDIPNTVKVLHDRNMKAVARMVMFHDQFLARTDSLLRPSKSDNSAWKESKRRNPSWLDSSNKKVQQELLYLISKVASQGVDEIQLDYIRFPTQGNISSAIFDFQKEDFIKAQEDSLYVNRKKEDIIVNFIRKAKSICEENNVKLTADVFAIVAWQRNSDIKFTGQNITRMAKYLDAIHPMIYSSHFANNFGFRENVHNEPYHITYKATRLSQKHTNDKCKVIPYIQANSWKVNYNYAYVIAQVNAIEDLNADGYILWNAANKYDKTLRWLKEYYRE